MKIVLTIVQFLSALGVIATVLMHAPKAEGMGGIGGAARIFGKPTSAEKGLDKTTYILAAVFVIVSILLIKIK